MKAVWFILVLLFAPMGFSQDKKPFDHELGFDQPRWYTTAHIGQSLLILGSEDLREGWCIGPVYGKPEPRFSNSWESGDLAIGLYYTDTGSTKFHTPGRQSQGIGLIAMMDMHRMWTRSWGYYYFLGWGIQYVNHPQIDLDSQLNSSPAIGAGFILFAGSREIRVGLDLLHLSNAGLQGSNQGQNQLYLTVGMRL